MELRRELRYRLDVPAVFCWENGRRRNLRGEGTTRDISVLGAFIMSSTCPPVETPVQLIVVLPALNGKKSAIQIIGEARVIRVEQPPGANENGFAVVRKESNQWSLAMVQDEVHVDGHLSSNGNTE
jgi:hypothetical protein